MTVRTWGLTGTNPLLPEAFRPKSGPRMGGRRTKTRGSRKLFAPWGFKKVSPACQQGRGRQTGKA